MHRAPGSRTFGRCGSASPIRWRGEFVSGGRAFPRRVRASRRAVRPQSVRRFCGACRKARSDRRTRSALRSIARRPICLPAAASLSAFAPASSTSAPKARSRSAELGAAAVALHWPASLSCWPPSPRSLIGRPLFGALVVGDRDGDPSRPAGARSACRRSCSISSRCCSCSRRWPGRSASSAPGSCSRRSCRARAWLWKLPESRRACRVPDRARRGGRAVGDAVAHAVRLRAARRRTDRGARRPMRASPIAGDSPGRAMLLAGALAGLAGGVEVLGVHHRLIEGFSLGFGFKAVTVALLGGAGAAGGRAGGAVRRPARGGSLSRCSGRSACPRRLSS